MSGCSGGNCSSCSDGSCSDDNSRLPPGMLSRYDLNQDTGLGVLIWAETDGSSVTEESLSLMSRVREQTEDRIFVVMVAPSDMKDRCNTLFKHGADTVYHIRCRDASSVSFKQYSDELSDISERMNPMCILIPSDEKGNRIANLVSMRIGHQLNNDCTSFRIEGNRLILEGSKNESVPLISRKDIHPIIATIRYDPSYVVKIDEGRKGTAITRMLRTD